MGLALPINLSLTSNSLAQQQKRFYNSDTPSYGDTWEKARSSKRGDSKPMANWMRDVRSEMWDTNY